MREDRCEFCKWFDAMNFKCQRRAPVVRVGSYEHEGRTIDTNTAEWPTVYKSYWCGEFERAAVQLSEGQK